MQMQRNTVLIGLIFAAAMSRLVPHAPNFTAVGAIALFGGATFKKRWCAVTVPLVAMVVSDLILGLFVYGFEDAFRYALPVYACVSLTALLGRACGRSWTGIGVGAVASTMMFYLVTNLAVWAGGAFYPMTAAGLVACYVAAAPFAFNMLLANLLFGAAMFGLLAQVERRRPDLAVQQTTVDR